MTNSDAKMISELMGPSSCPHCQPKKSCWTRVCERLKPDPDLDSNEEKMIERIFERSETYVFGKQIESLQQTNWRLWFLSFVFGVMFHLYTPIVRDTIDYTVENWRQLVAIAMTAVIVRLTYWYAKREGRRERELVPVW